MKNYALLLSLLLFSVSGFAQKITLSGKVIDSASKEPIMLATLQLMKPDSTYVTGVVTEENGSYKFSPIDEGRYILRASFLGYKSIYRNLQLTKEQPEHIVPTVPLEIDAILLKSADITARLAQVEMREDTFVYNSSAFRVPEGSVLEELVKKLPGAEVGDDGVIKINGKEVKKIMVDGKEFFSSDTKVAMKNIPTNMVEKIKAYERQSDMARITGIDDGEEETVLDLSVKKGMNQGWMSNIDLGYGTESRYTAKATGSRFTDKLQLTAIGSSNNVNDQGFPGGDGDFRGNSMRNGLITSKMAGINFSWTNGKREKENGRFEIGGNVRYNHSNTDLISRTNSQTFLTTGVANAFSNSATNRKSNNSNLNADFRMEWEPDTMTNIILRPNFSYGESGSRNSSKSVTFNNDPYEKLTDPLNEYETIIGDSTVVNSNKREALSNGRDRSGNVELQINRKLNNEGRNVTFRTSGGFSSSENTSFSISNINYYLNRNAMGNATNVYNNQYITNPSSSHNYSTQISYSEPLFKGAYLQGSYRFHYRYTDSERSMYSLDSIYTKMSNLLGYPAYEYQYPLGYIPSGDSLSLFNTFNIPNSQHASYRYYNHEASLMFRLVRKNYQFNAGINLQPQITEMSYKRNQLDTVVVRNVLNLAPRIRFRYKFSNTSQLNVRYNGRANQPSMADMLDVTDTSDPLNVRLGNPGLKPSWTNSFNLFYNDYIPDLQRGWMVHLDANQVSNSVGRAVFYDESSGANVSIPMNIQGNWSSQGAFMFNTALGEGKYFNVSTFTRLAYNQSVGYISSQGNFSDLTYRAFQNLTPDKSITKTTQILERINGNFRNDMFEFGVNGSINYQHARNDVQANANLDTYTFTYGGNFSVNFDFGLSLTTNISQNSRRGYDDKTMNVNELIWNAQVSQSFLKNRAATLSLQFYDILQRQNSISRSISATQRVDTWNNAIYSYAMLHFVYKLNLMGNREARQQGMGNFGGGDGPGSGGGRPPGGFGGGGGRRGPM